MDSRYARLLPTPYENKLSTAKGKRANHIRNIVTKWSEDTIPATQKGHPKRCPLRGWDRWIRTIEMPESKSGALPLGYIPIFAFVFYHILLLLSSIHFQKGTLLSIKY